VAIKSTIVMQLRQIASEQEKILKSVEDSTPLTETGLDSLCFAILVARLEDELGKDPFTASEEFYFPVTVGDLVQLYENAA